MMPKLVSEVVFFGIQNVYSLCVASKFNFKANLGSNGHPNGTPNGIQNRGYELAVRASVRAGASGHQAMILEPIWTEFKFFGD